jgi:hypothetical protein
MGPGVHMFCVIWRSPIHELHMYFLHVLVFKHKVASAYSLLPLLSPGRIFLLLFLDVGWDWVHWYVDHYWPIVTALDDIWRVWNNRYNYWQTFFAANPTWSDLESNVILLGRIQATNLLSYITAITWLECWNWSLKPNASSSLAYINKNA